MRAVDVDDDQADRPGSGVEREVRQLLPVRREGRLSRGFVPVRQRSSIRSIVTHDEDVAPGVKCDQACRGPQDRTDEQDERHREGQEQGDENERREDIRASRLWPPPEPGHRRRPRPRDQPPALGGLQDCRAQLFEGELDEAGIGLFRQGLAKEVVRKGRPAFVHRSTSSARSSDFRAACRRDFAVPSAMPSSRAISITGRSST